MVAEAGPAFIPRRWLCWVGGLSLDSSFYLMSCHRQGKENESHRRHCLLLPLSLPPLPLSIGNNPILAGGLRNSFFSKQK